VLHRGRRGYSLAQAVQEYLAYQAKFIEKRCGSDSAYELARTRRMKAQAITEELRAGEARGTLLRRDYVARVVMEVLSHARSHLLAIPSRVSYSLLPHVNEKDANFQAIYQKVNAEVHRGLNEASQLEKNGIGKRTQRERNGEEPGEELAE
jgi:phage terminase Nu1 subunit (DNA packaging protein)